MPLSSPCRLASFIVALPEGPEGLLSVERPAIKFQAYGTGVTQSGNHSLDMHPLFETRFSICEPFERVDDL